MPTNRLADILRMVFGGSTDGERLAAVAALERVMQSQGLDLHAFAARLEGQAGTDAARTTVSQDERLDMSDPTLGAVTDTIEDDVWPRIARWVLDQDEQWAATRNRHILKPDQIQFAEQMATEALTIRPSPKQCAWLLALADNVRRELARPAAQPRPRIAEVAQTGIGSTAEASRPEASLTAARTRFNAVPRRSPKPAPRPHSNTKDRLQWIQAIARAQQRPSRPIDQDEQPSLFSDAEFRALVCLATLVRSWKITRRSGDVFDRYDPPAAAEIARLARLSLRTVRRAIAKAQRSGYLSVAQPGGRGRGRRTAHQLTTPHPRFRGVPVGDERQATRTQGTEESMLEHQS